MRKCEECQKETNNPKFCSRSCSAKSRNRVHSRKYPTKYCKCGKTIWNEKTNCDECWKVIVQNRKPAKPRNSNPRPMRVRDDKTKCVHCGGGLNEKNSYKYKNGKFHPHCKICHNEYTKNIQRKFKADCIEYKGGKCVFCGYNLNNAALQFHHLNPKQKKITLSKYRSQKFDERIKPELDKCELLCGNCHRAQHSPKSRNLELNSINSLSDLVGFNSFRQIEDAAHQKKRKLIKKLGGKCVRCGFTRNYAALQFHHKDPNVKSFLISDHSKNDEKELINEIEKCELLCCNCHEIFHTSTLNNQFSISHIRSFANLIGSK